MTAQLEALSRVPTKERKPFPTNLRLLPDGWIVLFEGTAEEQYVSLYTVRKSTTALSN
jgi:hypothetical protein